MVKGGTGVGGEVSVLATVSSGVSRERALIQDGQSGGSEWALIEMESGPWILEYVEV